MISLQTPGRREFLRIGGLALGGLGLTHTLGHGGSSLTTADKPVTDKAVIFLFMHGGPSQIETFDPHMSAAVEFRSATGETQTSIPGVTFGGTFPKLAKMADRFTVVRSFVTGDGNHDIKPIVSKDAGMANLGSAYASMAGMNHPVNGMPLNVALFPQSVNPQSGPKQAGFGNFLSTGPYATGTTPFEPGSTGAFQKNLTLTLPQNRVSDRRLLLDSFDQAKYSFDAEAGGMDTLRQKAYSLLLGGVGEAFDLTKEDPKIVKAYDTEKLYDVTTINKKWNNKKHYTDNAVTLGKLLLLARRCVERGAGFVTVTTNFVWDMHADNNNATMTEGMSYMAPPFDHAVSVFLEDLKQRGLEDKVLLVCCGEMGRTPKINKNGGRDHWGELAPLLLAGGGLKLPNVIGQSDKTGGRPATEPVRIKNLISTVMHTLFDVGRLRVTRGVSRELLSLTDDKPIS